MSYLEVDVTSDPTQILQGSLAGINAQLATAGYPGWSETDPGLVMILLNQIAEIAAELGSQTNVVMPAIFRAFGTTQEGIAYQSGAYALVSSTWTFTAPTVSETIDGGTAVIIDGYAFYVADDVALTDGSTSATVLLIASSPGTAYNGLGSVGAAVTPSDEIDWVAGIALQSTTSGGTDAETDTDYQNKLSAVLQLQSPRPINAGDFAAMVLSDICADQTGVAVGRATSLDLYYPAPLTAVASFGSGSETMTLSTVEEPGSVPAVGALVTGAGLPSGEAIAASPAPTSTSAGLTSPTTSAESGETVTVSAWADVEGCTTTFVTDADGGDLSDPDMATLQAWLETMLDVNFDAFVQPPSRSTIYVAGSVHPAPGYTGAQAISDSEAAVAALLNPATWPNLSSQSASGTTPWLNSGDGYNLVRYNEILAAIGSVRSVAYVPGNGLTLGFSASPTGTADLLMPGPAPLPQLGAVTITAV